MPRVAKQSNIDQYLVNDALATVDNFISFTSGVRCLLLIHRAKEGALSSNNDKVRKFITTNPGDFSKVVYEMLVEKKRSGLPYRIYASVSDRNVDKAIRKFKQEQLDADYYAPEDKHAFYLDIENRFFGCLSTPSCATETLFVIDLDTKEEVDGCLKAIGNANLNDSVLKQYFTKNGMHLVTKAFNPALIGEYATNIHKDGLILLHF